MTAIEKLPEEDIQAFKYWLYEHHEEDTFETLVEWMGMRVQTTDEAKEETTAFAGRRNDERDKRRNDERTTRGFNTSGRKCIVQMCQEDHPPWVVEPSRN